MNDLNTPTPLAPITFDEALEYLSGIKIALRQLELALISLKTGTTHDTQES